MTNSPPLHGYALAAQIDELLNKAAVAYSPRNRTHYNEWLRCIRTIETSLEIIKYEMGAVHRPRSNP